MIGIICALPEEVEGFLKGTSRPRGRDEDFIEITLGPFEAVIGSSGLGKVNAAMTAALLLERFNCNALVSAGTAGGLEGVKRMQVIVGTELVQHDYGRSLGHGELELYRPGDPPLPAYKRDDIALTMPAQRVADFQAITSGSAHVRYGRYASGDTFVNDPATRAKLVALGALAVDMESAAVAQVAEFHGLPWLVAKGVSDVASEQSHEDFLAGLAEASRLSAQVVRALLPALLAARAR